MWPAGKSADVDRQSRRFTHFGDNHGTSTNHRTGGDPGPAGDGEPRPHCYRRARLDDIHNSGQATDLRPSRRLERQGSSRGTPEGGGAFAEVTNQAGKPMATLRTNMATGSTCLERYPYSVLESQELPALAQDGSVPRYVFETRGSAAVPGPANTPAAAYGITSLPAPTGGSACSIFHFFTWPPNAAMFGSFYNPQNNETPGDASLPYLEKAKIYAGTPEYQDIRRMITSLRPAG